MRIYTGSAPVMAKRGLKPSRKADPRVARRARAANSNAMMLYVSAIIFVAVAITMGYLAQRSALVIAYSHMEALEEQISELKQLCNEKSVELAEMTSIAKVETIARQKLGMVDARKVAVLLVAGEPVPVQAAAAPQPNEAQVARLKLEVPTMLAAFGSWLKSTAISATSSMISTWHANSASSLPDVLQ